jgi:transcriptional regulator with XRE-family HTH domain
MIRSDLAKKMGVHQNSINNKLNGKSRWNADEICKLCEIFNVESDYFFAQSVSENETIAN